MLASVVFSAALVASSSAADINPVSFFKNAGKFDASYGKRAMIDKSAVSTKATKSNGEIGYYEVKQFVTPGTCDGSYITEFFEYGNCQQTNNANEWSKLKVTGPTDDMFYFNRTFYEDAECTDGQGDFTYFTLPSVCQASDEYADDEAETGLQVMGLVSKLNYDRKTMGYVSWNSEVACDESSLSNANYMMQTNFKSCYPNLNANLTYYTEEDDFYADDENMTMYKSLIMTKCNKVTYFEGEDCTGKKVQMKGTFAVTDDASVCSMDDGSDNDAAMFSSYYCRDKKSGSRDVCFAGSSTVLTETGVTKMVSEVAIGDRVQVYSAESASMTFSEVIAVPHATNDVLATFVDIVTSAGSVKMTPDHLVASGACSAAVDMLPLTRAEDVRVGDCVHTAAGQSMVSSVNTLEEKGIYTFVTRAEFVVVGGVVASPFAVNHKILHFFYNLHRALPADSALVNVFHAVADQVTKIAVLPVIRSIFAVSV